MGAGPRRAARRLRPAIPPKNTPAAEVAIDEALVRRLLRAQCPDLADLPLVALASGWDNAIFRLGDACAVRLPRRALAADLVMFEQRWLPELAPRLPLPIPVPLRNGRPGEGYPWHWNVTRWFDGDIAARTPPADEHAAAVALGAFVAALNRPAPPDAPDNPFRGVPLAARTQRLHDAVEALGDLVDGDAVLALWSDLVSTPVWAGPAVWLHGDLHPANIVVHEGRISAVLDFGDLTSGDRATDLSVAWMLFGPETRPLFREAAGAVDDDTWRRARAWALALGLAYLESSADNPLFASLGGRVIEAALRDS